jgi:flagellar export protein FliJ
MADGSFRLQSVLNYKASVVEALEMEFARLRVVHQQEKETLTGLQLAEKQEMDSLRAQRERGPLDCDLIQLHQQYLDTLNDHVTQQNALVVDAAQKAETKREELVKTMQDQQMLQKLRQRHQLRQAREMLRRETRAVDEIVTTRYGRER